MASMSRGEHVMTWMDVVREACHGAEGGMKWLRPVFGTICQENRVSLRHMTGILVR